MSDDFGPASNRARAVPASRVATVIGGRTDAAQFEPVAAPRGSP